MLCLALSYFQIFSIFLDFLYRDAILMSTMKQELETNGEHDDKRTIPSGKENIVLRRGISEIITRHGRRHSKVRPLYYVLHIYQGPGCPYQVNRRIASEKRIAPEVRRT